jgi:hypothetical protein
LIVFLCARRGGGVEVRRENGRERRDNPKRRNARGARPGIFILFEFL